MRINHNIAALNTHRQLGAANNAQSNSMEKLASGLRINRAGDDAAGLAISEKMRGQIRGLDQAQSNAQDGISMIQTAEGALNETHSILQRMRELAVQSSNDTTTGDDRKEIQKEFNQLVDEVDRIAENTEFNTQSLLDGTFSNKKIQIGSNAGQDMTIGIANMKSDGMGTAGATAVTSTTTTLDFSTNGVDVTIGDTTVTLDQDYTGNIDDLASKLNTTFSNTEGVSVESSGTADLVFTGNASFTVAAADNGGTGGATAFGGASQASSGSTTGSTIKSLQDNSLDGSTGLQSQANASSAITSIDNAIKTVSSERSKLGAYQNRLDHTINNLGTSSENLTAAESRIRDVDYALAA
ncbi:Flagellin D [Paraliobacillus sp. PM-2]|uniref:flagellin N-terminal helical domain-containing protein n=1 Tax=Paraliobacillus sp. PM-2 TaxID=1462524 RepID=UPI00061CA534|nr:flagellin [Paraliobacillus sp. PM-2]CQR46402.1 Flagellin D [Paraliobacillus sp. PM-2]